ncbi:DUF3175 domain-containing protein [bacterium]|nr:MAG: DUF3175 domain-containing protein [bacterium]
MASRTRKSSSPSKASGGKWSARVTEDSHALALEEGVFTWNDPRQIAASLKRSAEASDCRKAEPFPAAMSMLNFYINRAGRNLPASRKKILEAAKEELRGLYGKGPVKPQKRRS